MKLVTATFEHPYRTEKNPNRKAVAKVMKRASYRDGVQWIAANDNSGSPDSLADVAGYVSTLLLADLFAVEPGRVARDIQRERAKLHKLNPGYCEVR